MVISSLHIQLKFVILLCVECVNENDQAIQKTNGKVEEPATKKKRKKKEMEKRTQIEENDKIQFFFLLL